MARDDGRGFCRSDQTLSISRTGLDGMKRNILAAGGQL